MTTGTALRLALAFVAVHLCDSQRSGIGRNVTANAAERQRQIESLCESDNFKDEAADLGVPLGKDDISLLKELTTQLCPVLNQANGDPTVLRDANGIVLLNDRNTLCLALLSFDGDRFSDTEELQNRTREIINPRTGRVNETLCQAAMDQLHYDCTRDHDGDQDSPSVQMLDQFGVSCADIRRVYDLTTVPPPPTTTVDGSGTITYSLMMISVCGIIGL